MKILGSFLVIVMIGLCYGIVLHKKLEESKQAIHNTSLQQESSQPQDETTSSSNP